GRQLAVQTDIGSEAVISIYDLKRGGPLRRLTFEGQNRYPVWTPDSRRVTFVSDRNDKPGIFWQMADGTQPAERLLVSRSPIEHRPEAWTRDGKTLIVVAPFDRRLFTLSPGSIALTPLSPDLLANESALSPDNKWLAYASTEIGNRLEIFVQPFPPTGAKYQVSTNGGRSPLWSPDGTQIYYWANLV